MTVSMAHRSLADDLIDTDTHRTDTQCIGISQTVLIRLLWCQQSKLLLDDADETIIPRRRSV